MASPNSTFTDMVTTTLRNHKRSLADNVSENNALLTLLKEKNKIKTLSGGYEIVEPLHHAENGTYQRYTGYDPLNVNPSDVLSAAKYDWSQVAIHVTASGRETKMNNSKEAMINLVEARIENAFMTAANNMSIDLYSDGSLTNQIGGLAHIIQNDGTGTVGGIVSGTYTFWKNSFYDMNANPSSSNVGAAFNTTWLKTVRGKDKTDLIVASHDMYSAFEAAQQQYQRYGSAKMAEMGFQALKYKTADVVFDDNSNFATTAEKAYFLNTDYLKLVEHSEARFSQDDERAPVNQDAVVIPLYWMGQLCCSNRSLQAVLFDGS